MGPVVRRGPVYRYCLHLFTVACRKGNQFLDVRQESQPHSPGVGGILPHPTPPSELHPFPFLKGGYYQGHSQVYINFIRGLSKDCKSVGPKPYNPFSKASTVSLLRGKRCQS